MERILPAYPLFVKDPNFSIWATTEILNSQEVEAWFGEKKKLYGFLKTKGKTYCFLGNFVRFVEEGVLAATQTSLSITAFSTNYEFLCGETVLKLRFVSPLPLTDLELLSMPVCYMEYEIIGDDDAEISVFVNRNFCYNDAPETYDKRVRGGVVPMDGFETACFGLLRQMHLSPSADYGGADWGYYYLAGEQAWIADEKEMLAYLANGSKDFRGVDDEKYLVAINRKGAGAVLIGFDDRISIEYYGEYRKGYYLEKHTIFDALTETWTNRGACEEKLNAFEADLLTRAKPYGEGYKTVLFASLRQTIAAHKLVTDTEGRLLWLSKECGSNGCIATVDVSYPSIPLYLLYAPELVKGMMRPILKFARMPVWKYDFAPHDAGTYPVCGGQFYGIRQGEDKCVDRMLEGGPWHTFKTHFPFYTLPASFDLYDFTMQMPVEECANMLVMFLAVYKKDGDITFFKENADLCAQWVEYLVKYGLRPASQLCTDDFAGHLANNVNLSIKAAVGIAAYAKLLSAVDDKEKSANYRKIAEEFAMEIAKFSEGKTHLPLTWDLGEETYSLKYNFAFDKLLGLGLFDQALLEKETAYYLTKKGNFGIPLDNRNDYAKSDWTSWVASLTDDLSKKKQFIETMVDFLKRSPDRVPFSDLHFAQSGKHHLFTNRTTQGACFILLLGVSS